MADLIPKILSLVPYRIYPAVMGGQKGIALFYRYLSQLLSLTVLTTQNNSPAEAYTVLPLLPVSRLRYVNPFLFFRVKKNAGEQLADHVLFEHPYFAWLIFLFNRFTSYRIILHSHNIESERFRSVGRWWWKLLWYYERLASRNAHILWFKTRQDMQYSILHYGIPEQHCFVIPYGIEADRLPEKTELAAADLELQKKYSIPVGTRILLFNGTLSYKPNLDAMKAILENINPLLLQSGLKYKILICGRSLPAQFDDLKAFADKNIIYCGFVDDIDLYFKGCHLFLNPVLDGGGIKTKLVEALGFGKYCVSSENGAIGVDVPVTGGRLTVVADQDWDAYASAIISAPVEINTSNDDFYAHYAWKNIALRAVASLRVKTPVDFK